MSVKPPNRWSISVIFHMWPVSSHLIFVLVRPFFELELNFLFSSNSRINLTNIIPKECFSVKTMNIIEKPMSIWKSRYLKIITESIKISKHHRQVLANCSGVAVYCGEGSEVVEIVSKRPKRSMRVIITAENIRIICFWRTNFIDCRNVTRKKKLCVRHSNSK